MPNTTPNLGLIKPLVTEQYDIAKVTNENADILDLEIKTVKDDVLEKQDILVSGTNIKTVNGASILESGDVELLPKNNPTATGTQTLPNIVTNGIKFPATQVPSADPNTLDDYEEGSFTTTFWSGRDKTGTSFTSLACRYVKIGSLVTLHIFRDNNGVGINPQSVTVPFIGAPNCFMTTITDGGVVASSPDWNVDYLNFSTAIPNPYVRFTLTYRVS